MLGCGVVAAALLLTRGPEGDSGPSEEAVTSALEAAAAEAAGVGGGGPPEYPEPIQITTGDYVSPSFPFEAVAEEGLAAIAAERGEAQFEGDVNGFRIYSMRHAYEDPSVEKETCVSVDFPLTDDLKIAYLPPGTFAIGPQYSGVCADGTLAFTLQEFDTKHAWFLIGYEPGERAFRADAPETRIEATEVSGRRAVIVHPVIEEGFGESVVAVATDRGRILVEADNLPLSETLKIAEGVQCEEC